MKLAQAFVVLSAASLTACTTAPYAKVGTTYKATIDQLEGAGKVPLGRLRTQVRTAYLESYYWDVAQSKPNPIKPSLRTLLCQPQRPYSRAVSNLALQTRAAKGIEAIAQPTPKELAPAIGTLGANYSLKLPPVPGSNDTTEKDAFEICSDDATVTNPAGDFVNSGSVREAAGGVATGLTEVISILTPTIVSFIGIIDQRRRAEAIRTYFGACADESDKSGKCGNAVKLIDAVNVYGGTIDALNRYERGHAVLSANKLLVDYYGAAADKKEAALKSFLEAGVTYDTALDSNILPYSKAVAATLERLRKIADNEPDAEDLPAVIESFVVATQAFLAAAVAQEQLADDAETRKKLGEALDKFLGREKKPKP